MARKGVSLAIFSILLVALNLNIGETKAAELIQTWCVAKPSVSDKLMNENIGYACNHVGPDDCNPIKEGSGSSCFNPNTIINHASYAMNVYYKESGCHQWDCSFQNSGLISLKDPSHDGCIYQGGQAVIDLSTSGMWCVANPSASAESLQSNINYACSHVDCSVIDFNGSCYNPNSLISRASVAMNLYYQSIGRPYSGCDFKNTGLIVTTDPSYGNCVYEFRK